MASSNKTDAHVVPTPDELQQALSVKLYDSEGKTHTLSDLTKDKRSVLIFTRHYWCLNCQAYVRIISQSIPPSKLPANTQILIISNGSYQPIDTYARNTSSAHPIYTDPECRIHAILKFNSGLSEGDGSAEKRDYMRDAGGTMSRIVGGIKGALGNLQHTAYIGPKSLNGGEVIIGADGQCEYMYRMQTTVDHTSVADLMKIVGVETAPLEQK